MNTFDAAILILIDFLKREPVQSDYVLVSE